MFSPWSCLAGVEYLTPWASSAMASVASDCSRPLEVMQCVSGLGAGEVQLRTQGAMHVALTPLGYNAHTKRESAAQGMVRTPTHGWGNPAGRVDTPASPGEMFSGENSQTPGWWHSGAPVDSQPAGRESCAMKRLTAGVVRCAQKQRRHTA